MKTTYSIKGELGWFTIKTTQRTSRSRLGTNPKKRITHHRFMAKNVKPLEWAKQITAEKWLAQAIKQDPTAKIVTTYKSNEPKRFGKTYNEYVAGIEKVAGWKAPLPYAEWIKMSGDPLNDDDYNFIMNRMNSGAKMFV